MTYAATRWLSGVKLYRTWNCVCIPTASGIRLCSRAAGRVVPSVSGKSWTGREATSSPPLFCSQAPRLASSYVTIPIRTAIHRAATALNLATSAGPRLVFEGKYTRRRRSDDGCEEEGLRCVMRSRHDAIPSLSPCPLTV